MYKLELSTYFQTVEQLIGFVFMSCIGFTFVIFWFPAFLRFCIRCWRLLRRKLFPSRFPEPVYEVIQDEDCVRIFEDNRLVMECNSYENALVIKQVLESDSRLGKVFFHASPECRGRKLNRFYGQLRDLYHWIKRDWAALDAQTFEALQTQDEDLVDSYMERRMQLYRYLLELEKMLPDEKGEWLKRASLLSRIKYRMNKRKRR